MTGGGTHGTGRGLEGGPRARARAPRAPRDRRDGAWEPGGKGESKGGGGGRGAPAAGRAASEVHPPRHPTDAGAPNPPPPPPPPPPLQHRPRRWRAHPPPNPDDPSSSQPPPQRERSRRGWPRRGGGRGAAPAPQAQGQQGELARGAEGARPWDRDWGTVLETLGDEPPPLVGEVYGWLSWANQGTTRGLGNQPFDAVLGPEGHRKP